MESVDFTVIGAGVLGLSIARALRKAEPDARIVVLEKEPELGAHASGRNSGVLHAGFYYARDSLKARFCRNGNLQLREYCAQRGLTVREFGKLVVTRSEEELPRLDELYDRGRANGVDLRMVDEAEARLLEPRARTVRRALHSPTTASISPKALLTALAADLQNAKVDIRRGEGFSDWREGKVWTTRGDTIRAGQVINVAGAHADRIARIFGHGSKYGLLPFKGVYLKSRLKPGSFRMHVYPVPDPRMPFLGVHWTVLVDGSVKIGPTATLAFGREHYEGLPAWREASQLARRAVRLMVREDAAFRSLAIEETFKLSKAHLIRLAAQLCPGVTSAEFSDWAPPGIRAQLLDLTTGKLVQDFVIEGNEESVHVLNGVSPGLTCSLPFGEHVVHLARSLSTRSNS